jgi:hypothetical protein
MHSTKPKEVLIPAGAAKLRAILTVTSHAKGIVGLARGGEWEENEPNYPGMSIIN